MKLTRHRTEGEHQNERITNGRSFWLQWIKCRGLADLRLVDAGKSL
jgi:hypothetical protein